MVAAHLRNALDHPGLYRVVFDANLELEDLKAADATLEHLVQAVERGRKADRFRADTDPLEPAIRSRVVVRGPAAPVANGPLTCETLAHGVPLPAALFVSGGSRPRGRCRPVGRERLEATAPAWRLLSEMLRALDGGPRPAGCRGGGRWSRGRSCPAPPEGARPARAEVRRPEKRVAHQPVIDMLVADGGEFLGFTLVTARRR